MLDVLIFTNKISTQLSRDVFKWHKSQKVLDKENFLFETLECPQVASKSVWCQLSANSKVYGYFCSKQALFDTWTNVTTLFWMLLCGYRFSTLLCFLNMIRTSKFHLLCAKAKKKEEGLRDSSRVQIFT